MDVVVRREALGVDGRLDASCAADVRARLNRLIDSTVGDVVIDLSGVDLVDATGLGVLAGAHRRLRRTGRRLILRGCGAHLRRVLAVTGLRRVMYVEPAGRIAV
ncbi:MAG: anti-sigma factor antagonist [Propionibacteriales bacterium]|nr:anti-sigma factor antagonist [Propionibacteriales bacterium]